MTTCSQWQRILWHEGMYLLPQQFQQHDRAMQRQYAHLGAALHPHPWGLTRLEFDEDALAGGSLRLEACAGIMPDGFAFALPGCGDPPPARPLEGGNDRRGVYLALPEEPTGGSLWSETGQHDGRPTRFIRRECELHDAAPEGQSDGIALAVPNFRLLLDGDGLEHHSLLRVGEVIREAAGGWKLADDVAPPCLHLRASPILARMLRQAVDFLATRARELAAQRRARASGLIEVSSSEIGVVLAATAVARTVPVLRDLVEDGRGHPHQAWSELARLAGELSVYDGGDTSTVPAYRHDNAAAPLSALVESLRESLGTSAPTRYVPLILKTVNDRISSAQLPDGLVGDARFFIGVQSSLPPERITSEVPTKLKLASAGRIGALIAKALRGVEIEYLSVPPTEIPAQAGHYYFEIITGGSEWEGVVDSSSIAIYTPPDLSDLSMELLAVRAGGSS